MEVSLIAQGEKEEKIKNSKPSELLPFGSLTRFSAQYVTFPNE